MSTLVRPFTPGKRPLVVTIPDLRATIRRRFGRWTVTIIDTNNGRTVTTGQWSGALPFSTICTVANRLIITNTARLYLADLEKGSS